MLNSDQTPGFSLVRGVSTLSVPATVPNPQKVRLQELTNELMELGGGLESTGMAEEAMSEALDRLEENLKQSNEVLNGAAFGKDAKGYAFQLILIGQELIGEYCDRLVKATPFRVFKEDAIKERRSNEEDALRRIAGVILETRAETAQQVVRANRKARAASVLGSRIKTEAGKKVAEKLLPSFFFKNLRDEEIDRNGSMIAAAIDEAERQAQDNQILHSALDDERTKRDALVRDAVAAERNRLQQEISKEFSARKASLEAEYAKDAVNLAGPEREALKAQYEKQIVEYRQRKERQLMEALEKYKQAIKEKIGREFSERVEKLKSMHAQLKAKDSVLVDREGALSVREAAVEVKENEIEKLRGEFEALRREVAELKAARTAPGMPSPAPQPDAELTEAQTLGRGFEVAFHEVVAETGPVIDEKTIAELQAEIGHEPAVRGKAAPHPTEEDLDYLFGDTTAGINRESAVEAGAESAGEDGKVEEYLTGLKKTDPKRRQEYNVGRFARGMIASLNEILENGYSEEARDTLFRHGIDVESSKMKEYLNVRLAENAAEGSPTVSWFLHALNRHLEKIIHLKGMNEMARVSCEAIYQANFSQFLESNFLGTRVTQFVDGWMNRNFWLRRNRLSVVKCNVMRLRVEYLSPGLMKNYRSCVLYIELESLGRNRSQVVRVEPRRQASAEETTGIRLAIKNRMAGV